MFRRSAAVLVASALLVSILVGQSAGANAAARTTNKMPPVVAGSDYLAIGDSISFGYREPSTSPPPKYAKAATFVGFPEVVASDLGLNLANVACPGETSASFINPKAPSYGCENYPINGKSVPIGYRTLYPLHVKYSGSQLAAGVAYLKTHHRTRLVTLMIGANDFFLCQATTKDKCTSQSEQVAVLSHLAQNVKTILHAIRVVYENQIVLVGYYSIDYNSEIDNAASLALNGVLQSAGSAFNVELADGYTAFEDASQYSGGDPCKAGLLTQLYTSDKPNGTCGVHPTLAGASVLASAVDRTVKKY